uniref:Uncharacterized protein n=1 Tax=Cannabis sativa TaxID=3483 RepID=A0A803QDZ0_CANSA
MQPDILHILQIQFPPTSLGHLSQRDLFHRRQKRSSLSVRSSARGLNAQGPMYAPLPPWRLRSDAFLGTRTLIRAVVEVLVVVWCESRNERLDDRDDVVVFMSLVSLETGKDIDNGDDDGVDFGG